MKNKNAHYRNQILPAPEACANEIYLQCFNWER